MDNLTKLLVLSNNWEALKKKKDDLLDRLKEVNKEMQVITEAKKALEKSEAIENRIEQSVI